MLNVAQLGPVQWNKQAFERLVLDPQSKELINALVSVHLSGKKASDIISGKGNGLIILLHGSPGVGKTLTAGMQAEAITRQATNKMTERYFVLMFRHRLQRELDVQAATYIRPWEFTMLT